MAGLVLGLGPGLVRIKSFDQVHMDQVLGQGPDIGRFPRLPKVDMGVLLEINFIKSCLIIVLRKDCKSKADLHSEKGTRFFDP